MNLETLIGKEHFDYKTYRDNLNVVIEAIDEIAFLSNTLDYERLIVFFKEVVETFDYYKNIDENDDNSEGFSNMNNKEQLLLNIIDSDEYNNLINFLETYQATIIRKSANLKEKILDLITLIDNNNSLILDDLRANIELISSKIKGIKDKLQDNIADEVPSSIDEKKLKFDIKIITKNDIICILPSYKFLKNLVYKQMHVLDKEYYTATKEDILAFRKELYKLYQLLCDHFNKNKNTYIEDISEKFQEVVVSQIKSLIEKSEKTDDEADEADEAEDTKAPDEAPDEDTKAPEKAPDDDANAPEKAPDDDANAPEDDKAPAKTEELDKSLNRIATLKAELSAAPAGTRAEPAGTRAEPAAAPPPPPPPLSPPPPPSAPLQKTAVEEATNAATDAATAKLAQVEAQGKALADTATAKLGQVEAQGKAVADTATAKLAQATQLKEQARANVEAEIAKQKAVVGNLLSPLTSLTSLTKGANGEPASPSGILSQLAQKALTSPK
jgi:hypothetical protein